MITQSEALDRLREGNRRFASGTGGRGIEGIPTHSRRSELVTGQAPFATILSCSDSRVPPEIVFDRGLGDLFVVRVAGNIADPSQIGSIEFAAKELGARLVVVMGHTGCGAVQATLGSMNEPDSPRSPYLSSIIDRVRPAVEFVTTEEGDRRPEAILEEAIRVNARRSARILSENSQVLKQQARDEGLLVITAVYSLETGVVDFLDPSSGGNSDEAVGNDEGIV